MKKKKKNKLLDYFILTLICIVPILTIIGFIFYSLDVNNPILFNTIGIIATGAIAVIAVIGLGFKTILQCIAISFTFVGLLSIIFKPIPAIIVLVIGLALWQIWNKLDKKYANKSLHRTAEPLCGLENKEKK